MKQRYHFLDNIRWATVLLVVLYHVFYNFNSLGIFGAVGGFAEHQPQDLLCTLLHPWFMTLLFVVAGASSRYALRSRTPLEFRRERTRKLLVPSTLGLLVGGWILGQLNMRAAGAWQQMPAELPFLVRHLIASVSGTGPLWFLHDLFIFSLLLLALRKMAGGGRVEEWLMEAKEWAVWLALVGCGIFLWAAAQTHLDSPSAAGGLINLYRPIYYFGAFLVGYYLLSAERVHSVLKERARVLVALATVAAVAFGVWCYGEDYTSPALVQSVGYNLYVWIVVMAAVGGFARWADRKGPIAEYLSQSSFGIYVVHMTICTAACLWLKESSLPVWSIYLVVLAVTAAGSFVAYELLRRVPVVRYCLFGIRSTKRSR